MTQMRWVLAGNGGNPVLLPQPADVFSPTFGFRRWIAVVQNTKNFPLVKKYVTGLLGFRKIMIRQPFKAVVLKR